MKRLGTYQVILLVILIAALGMLFLENTSAITGHATSGNTVSNVSIQQYLAIAMSNNLSVEGIQFGTVNTLGQFYNASRNYNGTSSSTLYWIEVSNNSNTAVDLCTRVNAGLTSSGADVIGAGNESFYANTTVSNVSLPDYASRVNYTTSNQAGNLGVPIGNFSYFRFWLYAPLGQPVGTYNNTVYFDGFTTGTGC